MTYLILVLIVLVVAFVIYRMRLEMQSDEHHRGFWSQKE